MADPTASGSGTAPEAGQPTPDAGQQPPQQQQPSFDARLAQMAAESAALKEQLAQQQALTRDLLLAGMQRPQVPAEDPMVQALKSAGVDLEDEGTTKLLKGVQAIMDVQLGAVRQELQQTRSQLHATQAAQQFSTYGLNEREQQEAQAFAARYAQFGINAKQAAALASFDRVLAENAQLKAQVNARQNAQAQQQAYNNGAMPMGMAGVAGAPALNAPQRPPAPDPVADPVGFQQYFQKYGDWGHFPGR